MVNVINSKKEQPAKNQVDLVEYLLERKRSTLKEIKEDFNRPEIQEIIKKMQLKDAR